ncbi:hypothetical protein NDU88_003810 [Pleurodeles waltl]|uniref:Uncharacterized protein n=1 Tax=Pleurodeles waltl TaxID=8319 RepID=A0AAV7V3I1_PLEWA|nr:hypothetical protein NDU88_003810 [Pleurodeles waltl]
MRPLRYPSPPIRGLQPRIRSMVDSWAESVMSWCVASGCVASMGRGSFVWSKASEKSNCLAGLPEFLWNDRPPGNSGLVAEPDSGVARGSGVPEVLAQSWNWSHSAWSGRWVGGIGWRAPGPTATWSMCGSVPAGSAVQFLLQERKRVSAREEKASVRRDINVTTGRGPQTSAGRGKGAPLGRAHWFHTLRIVLRVVSRGPCDRRCVPPHPALAMMKGGREGG